MNTNEAAQFLQAVARAHPGRVTVTRTIAEQWAADLAHLTVDEANLAWATWRTDPAHAGHTLTSADVLAAHRHGTGAAIRPETRRPLIDLPPAQHRPDIAHAELAKMRAVLGEASPYSGRRP